jgi:hypothetical protein
VNAGPDPDGFIDFLARELASPLRALTPGEQPKHASRSPASGHRRAMSASAA